ncbi:23S rRNA (adenine(2503)-C(2))-methyltransferase RlmN [Campylobacter lanienae]|uniref:23S rRNA (adenine(2503)-C(2))-methyltransferase RlmN n=1 Tax=Campylobacter lanienae TaxID=75658 RepID=UPI0011AC423C|nr:23S rRNA (adenine(2503)-C(2))-methyltransferase RlmN [Campylobacter lanienae]TWO16998.1 23S rRNA (adenine(2503)-C(2))-methyltransferase RlmN [Campylobacter lanienae]
MKNLLDYTQNELANIIKPKFRAKQIYEWIYKKNAKSFDEMSNLPKDVRENLKGEFQIDPLSCVRSEISKDGSIKYLFKLHDGKTIESVLLPMKDEILDQNGKVEKHARYTICVSSQVGCKMGCSFCLTAKGGFIRNLSAGEIVGQILWIKRENNIPYERRVNIVYMGMGEPLDNLDNVSKAINILKDNDGLAIGARRQTISTSGLATQIKKLGEMDLGVLLAISLHAVTDELREKLMPVNKAYNIASVMDAVRQFPIDMRKRVMFEYLIMDKINDNLSDAKALVKLLHGIKAKVNLILFNPHEGSPYQRPSQENVDKFRDYLQSRGVTCTIRQSKGLDISAACGQLKERSKGEDSATA